MSRFIILRFFYRAYITFVSKFLRILDLITLATINLLFICSLRSCYLKFQHFLSRIEKYEEYFNSVIKNRSFNNSLSMIVLKCIIMN